MLRTCPPPMPVSLVPTSHTDPKAICVASGLAVVVVGWAVSYLSRFTNAIIEEDRQEEPKGSKWIPRGDSEDNVDGEDKADGDAAADSAEAAGPEGAGVGEKKADAEKKE